MNSILIIFILYMILIPVFGGGESALAVTENRPFIIVLIREPGVAEYENAVKGFTEAIGQEKIPFFIYTFDRDDSKLILKIKKTNPDIIVTLGSIATNLVGSEIKDIPIVYSMVIEPEVNILHAANITGVSLDIPVNLQLKTLKMVAPELKRIGIIYNPSESAALVQKAVSTAQEMGFTLKTYPAATIDKIPDFNNLAIDLLWLIPDYTIVGNPTVTARLIRDGLKYNIASMGFSRFYARSGALLAIGCDYEDIGKQSAEMVLKIRKRETNPNAKIIVPRKVKFYINRAAADLLKITISAPVIQSAAEVFQ